MEKIPSFSKNHDLIEPGRYECGEHHAVTTCDLRCKEPNAGDRMEQEALHTIEHIGATILRNGRYKDGIIYFGPMGCRTGFYLLTYGLNHAQVLEMLKDCFKRAQEFTEIPGSRREECGNCSEHDKSVTKRS